MLKRGIRYLLAAYIAVGLSLITIAPAKAQTGNSNSPRANNSNSGATADTAAQGAANRNAPPPASAPAPGTTTESSAGKPQGSPPAPLMVTAASEPCQLNHTLSVVISDLPALLAKVTDATTKVIDLTKITLYLDSYPLKGVLARIGDKKNELLFDLKRTDASKESWNSLLGRPPLPPFRDRPVSVTVGLPDEPPLPTAIDGDGKKAQLVVVDHIWFWVYLALLIFLIVLFIRLARESDIIRDSGPNPIKLGADGQPVIGSDGKPVTLRKSFSLGRTQMAVWFFLVIAAYIFIWMVTSAYDSLSNSVLALIGISAGTAMGSAIIDESKRNEAKSQVETLTTEKAGLEAEQSTATPDHPFPSAKQERLRQINTELQSRNKSLTPQPTVGFIHDILSDATGVTFHRFQIALWTLVLGIIFTAQVYNILTMPDFSNSLLGLMGISGGTYLGFKFPEKTS